MKKVQVNENCIGCGACTSIADEVFMFNDDMVAEANHANDNYEKMSEELRDKVMDALEGCPAGAIEIVEAKDEKCHCGNECDCDCDSECECEDCHCKDE